jgi:Na+-translocating ferredoxin:NAD+ oxidoreductase RnfC subunit
VTVDNEIENKLGGAGFPTYAKLDQRAETIILNCAECEPLLRLHRQLLEKYETCEFCGYTRY